jgi:GAF domain-containing protein
MEDSQAVPRPATLEAAHELIARQAVEIDALRGQRADEQFARELKETFRLAIVAGTIAAPREQSRLPEMILETATRLIGAVAGSIFSLDHETGELVVEWAVGPRAAEARQIRLPPGRGVAGLVVATGQAVALSDAQGDVRHAREVAERVGYLPKSILAVPLLSDDRAVGALELLDRVDGASFSPADMRTLASFAEQAAMAMEQSRTLHSVAALIGQVLRLVDDADHERVRQLHERAREVARRIEQDLSYRRALELARLVLAIVDHGDAEAELCATVLRGFDSYLTRRPRPFAGLGALP